jgi:multidrug efflux system outer membrane protein
MLSVKKNCLLLLVLLTACQPLKPYEWPVTPVPGEWKEEASSSDTGRDRDGCACLENWWEIFSDPILNELEEQALASSYTLWGALERVMEARALAEVNFAPLLPSFNLRPSYNRVGALVENPILGIGSGNGCTSASSTADVQNAAATLPNLPSSFRFVNSEYLIPLNFSYELDLWSRLNNAYYATVMRAQASSQAYLGVMLSLTSDIASSYFQIRSLDAQVEVLERTIAVRQHALDINRARYKAGLIVYVDVSRAEVELARARSDWDDIKRLRALEQNRLAALVGVPAPIFSLDIQPLIGLPPIIPPGLPSELLCRRPDIAEAERNLAAAYRDIGVAYGNFFPSFTLNAAFGVGSPFACELFSWKSRFWQVGWSIVQSVFDGGKNLANLRYYKAIYCEAMAEYQETVLQSFKDVEDSLSNLTWYKRRSDDLKDAVQAARVTLELSQMRYDRGLVNYLDVVDAERQLLETEQNSVIVQGNRFASTVMLIKALGGGWGDCCEWP